MQKARTITQSSATKNTIRAPKMSRKESAEMVQKYHEKKAPYQANMIDYYLRKDEEIGYIDNCYDDSCDELALLREFGL